MLASGLAYVANALIAWMHSPLPCLAASPARVPLPPRTAALARVSSSPRPLRPWSPLGPLPPPNGAQKAACVATVAAPATRAALAFENHSVRAPCYPCFNNIAYAYTATRLSIPTLWHHSLFCFCNYILPASRLSEFQNQLPGALPFPWYPNRTLMVNSFLSHVLPHW